MAEIEKTDNIKDLSWELFANTGDVNAYLLYKESDVYDFDDQGDHS